MMSGKCLESAMTVLKRWRQEVTNFLKQKARIAKQTSIATKKSDKSGIFAPIAGKLVDVGGGNKAELFCAGFLDSSGAKQLANPETPLDSHTIQHLIFIFAAAAAHWTSCSSICCETFRIPCVPFLHQK